MATLTELYVKVRTQTDTVQSELPDALINQYLQEAFIRTIAAENIWPFYEQTWSLTLVGGTDRITLPGDVNEPGIIGLWDEENQFRLDLIDTEKGLDYFESKFAPLSPFGPHAFSLWARDILFHPKPNWEEDRAYRLLGFRKPVAWSSLGVSDSPDCDERLHLALAHYATALAYAREEDETLEESYMGRWQRDVEMARQAIMEPNRMRPLTMGPDFTTGIGPWPTRTSFRPGGVVINTP